MAEARAAVGFQFKVSPDGHILSVDYDRDVLALILDSVKRGYKKRWARVLNGLQNGLFPVGPEVLLGNTVILLALYLGGVDVTYGAMEVVHEGLTG